jgi:hypothetical protein
MLLLLLAAQPNTTSKTKEKAEMWRAISDREEASLCQLPPHCSSLMLVSSSHFSSYLQVFMQVDSSKGGICSPEHAMDPLLFPTCSNQPVMKPQG